MPKTSRGKSGRKPLSDISNSRKPSKTVNKAVKDDNACFDRLVSAHSDLSKLISEIDALVMRAYKLKQMHKLGNHEVESFINVLSNAHSSLQPWLPRFQQALTRQPSKIGTQENQTPPKETVSMTNEDRRVLAQCPLDVGLGSSLSPSPLVSWQAECKIDNGRQLFLLTPLPKSKPPSMKPLASYVSHIKCSQVTDCSLTSLKSSKVTDSSFSPSKSSKITDSSHCAPESSPLSPPAIQGQNDCLQTVNNNLSRNKNAVYGRNKEVDSYQKLSTPYYLVTPCLKTSPPKTCLILNHIPESSHEENNISSGPTPVPVKFLQFDEFPSMEDSDEEVSRGLMAKYPELFGFQAFNKTENERKELESPDWAMSPPKTCVLMMPAFEKLSVHEGANNSVRSHCVKSRLSKCQVLGRKVDACGRSEKKLHMASPMVMECTPIWKGSQATPCMGKAPGEQTLKRELWTKFEEVSANLPRSFAPAGCDSTRRGFLHRLEEEIYSESREKI
ncbi:uncharacterized protein LOC18443442 [Amborella trichopoda]|uniref:uncharacterized protein LOC18443442 n=1 Tax=Amborella trichopoda TaxID=13333 RepID=UPI0005D31CCC|nr:uncharacterized protein LOC18443442 [Amborella trichopoda]|eukprot:XP_011626749.1 uncharacterized protein LOC18443442 [Amborella trichopoda]